MKRKKAVTLTTAALALTMAVCGSSTAIAASELTAESKPATQYTIDANQEVYALLDFEDTAEFENATKGLIASPDTLDIYDENGKLVWSQTAYAFLDQDAPDTANPSLWRDTQLNHIYGLFEVTDGIYQVRGYDMSNITFIKGDTGWIVVDPLMSMECAAAAFSLVEENLGTFPVKAVIYSHSHIDHFGGVRGIISEEDVQSGDVQVIAPEGFEKHAVSENIYAGTAMGAEQAISMEPCLRPVKQELLPLVSAWGSPGAVQVIFLLHLKSQKPVRSILLMEWKLNFSLLRVPKHRRR